MLQMLLDHKYCRLFSPLQWCPQGVSSNVDLDDSWLMVTLAPGTAELSKMLQFFFSKTDV